MGYLDNLRKKIGTDPVIMPGANVIILNKDGKILMHHRRDRDWWGLPGGMMEIGETLEETAIREVKEEINLDVSNLKIFNIYSGPEFFYIYPDGNQVHNVTATYICKVYSGEIIVEETEGRDAKFFSLEDLPKNISSTIQPILNELKDRFHEFL